MFNDHVMQQGPSPQVIDDVITAAQALADGHLAALPTETVYGLAARADLPDAVARIYAVKGRPADHPLIVHVSDLEAARAWAADVPRHAVALAEACWPGPLTLVLPRSTRASDAVTGGQETVALRVSSHPVFRGVLDALIAITRDEAIGLAAPSANRFGRVSPTTTAHVVDELTGLLGPSDVVVEGGSSSVGIESTIVDCTGDAPVLLRPGAVTADDIARITGLPLGTTSTARVSGSLPSHYAPTATVRILRADEVPAEPDSRTGLLALADVPTPPGMVRLSAPESSADYAVHLYAALRQADALQLAQVIAVPPPAHGIGAAILDRLTRAATR